MCLNQFGSVRIGSVRDLEDVAREFVKRFLDVFGVGVEAMCGMFIKQTPE